VTLKICRVEHPEISSSTFYGIINTLSRHNLIRKIVGQQSSQKGYQKTREFTIEKAMELVKAKSARESTRRTPDHTKDVKGIAREQEMSSRGPQIGFMVLYEDPSEKFFVEAILTTDKNGYPIEYRFTDRIPINATQRILYGNTLRTYLVLEVVGLKLLNKLEQMPTLILVKGEELLELRERTKCPMLCVEHDVNSDDPKEMLFKTHQKYRGDIDRIRSLLKSYREQVPLDEPFKRIIKALQKSFPIK